MATQQWHTYKAELVNFGGCGDPKRFRWACNTSKQKKAISLLTTLVVCWLREAFRPCQQLIIKFNPTI